MQYKISYIDALLREIDLRKDYLEREIIETIYFGGGTPSLLNPSDFEQIFGQLNRLFDLSHCKEITLEVNPDDITPEFLRGIKAFPFNRISMGVQSFNQEDLNFLNRRHTREQAIEAIQKCKQAGYTNLSIDLIYGLPDQNLDKWHTNLEEFLVLDIPHLSAYHLIYEQNTPLYKLMETGRVRQIEEEESLKLFSLLIDKLTAVGYEHYEISNFSRPGYISQHNSSYWKGITYLGLGPSAHSYNGINREWNTPSLPGYLHGINTGKPKTEKEELDIRTRYNEFIITRLRTAWGININDIRQLFGEESAYYFQKQIAPFVARNLIQIQDNNTNFSLTKAGIFISDSIISDLLCI